MLDTIFIFLRGGKVCWHQTRSSFTTFYSTLWHVLGKSARSQISFRSQKIWIEADNIKMTRDDWRDRHLLNSIAATGLLHSKITSTNMYRLFCDSWFSVLIPFAMNQSQQTKQLRLRMLDTVVIYCIFYKWLSRSTGGHDESSRLGNNQDFRAIAQRICFSQVWIAVDKTTKT